jgi:bla regulator protein BlaR1
MTMGIDNLSTFVCWLGTASWQASVIIVLVLLIHACTGRWLTPRWRLALWSVVFIRLLMPVPPASEWSVHNYTPQPQVGAVVVSGTGTVTLAPFSLTTANAPPAPVPAVVLWDYAALTWLSGSVAVGLFMLIVALRLSRRLAVLPDVLDARLQRLLAEARTTMRLRRVPRVVIDPRAAAPALFGLLRPTLVLPPGLIDQLDDQQLRHVLLHEFAHLRRRDLVKNWLLIAMTTLHWFNPLIWLAFARYRADREMVCDTMVLSRLSPAESKSYGQTLIHVLEQIAAPRRLPMMVGIGESFAQLKRRIIAITRFGKLSRASAVVGVLALLILAATTLTGAAEEAAPPVDSDMQPVEQRGSIIAAPTDETNESASTHVDNFHDQRQLERARDLYQQRKFHEALVAVNAVLTRDPNNFTARVMRDMITPNARRQQDLNEDIARKLDQRIAINFDHMPLLEALNTLSLQIGLSIFVNWEELEKAGVKADWPLTLQLSRLTSTANALVLILHEASFDNAHDPLDYMVHDGVVKISTRRALLRSTVEPHTYDVRDLFNTFNGDARKTAILQVLDLVRQVGSPEEWQAAGGEVSSVTELNGNLIVNTYPQNHMEILALLTSLRATRLPKVRVEATALFVPTELLERIDTIDFQQPVALLDDLEAMLLRRAAEQASDAAVLHIPLTMLTNGVDRDTHRGMNAWRKIDDAPLYGVNLKSRATVDATRQWVHLWAQTYVINTRDARHSGPIHNVWKFAQAADVPDKGTAAFTSNEIVPHVRVRDDETGELLIDVRDVRVVMLIKPIIVAPTEVENLNFPGLNMPPPLDVRPAP